MAFASGDCRKRRLSVLVTSAMPSGAVRLAETNRFPPEEHVHQKEEWTLSNSNPKVLVRLSGNTRVVHTFSYCEQTGNTI